MTFSNGKHKELTIDELSIIQPGLARIMPEVGAPHLEALLRREGGQLGERDLAVEGDQGPVRAGRLRAPKHEDALNEYMEKDWSKLEAPLKARDFAGVREGVPRRDRVGERVARPEGQAVHQVEAARLPAARSRLHAAVAIWMGARTAATRVEVPVKRFIHHSELARDSRFVRQDNVTATVLSTLPDDVDAVANVFEKLAPMIEASSRGTAAEPLFEQYGPAFGSSR
jgi:hypothetical protein